MYQILCEDAIIHSSATPVCSDASCPCQDEAPYIAWWGDIVDPVVQDRLLAINEARNQVDREMSEFYRIMAEAQ